MGECRLGASLPRTLNDLLIYLAEPGRQKNHRREHLPPVVWFFLRVAAKRRPNDCSYAFSETASRRRLK